MRCGSTWRIGRGRPVAPLVLCAGVSLAALVLIPSRSIPTTIEEKREAVDALYATYCRSFPDVPSISVDELVRLLDEEGIVLVDVRESDEWSVSRIPGAVSTETFERDFGRSTDRTIVTYCTVGCRSGPYARVLRGRGLKALNLRGGVLAWVLAGRGVVDDKGETNRVHVYARRWSLVPPGYEAVWGGR